MCYQVIFFEKTMKLLIHLTLLLSFQYFLGPFDSGMFILFYMIIKDTVA